MSKLRLKRDKQKKKDDFIPLEEAVAMVMSSMQCTREEALNLLAIKQQAGEIATRKVALEQPPPVSSSEAVEAFKAKSESVFMPLGYFINTFGFDPQEIMEELRSGRLRASTSQDSRFSMLAGQTEFHADEFRLTAKAIHEWLFDPQTPPHLIGQMNAAMLSPDFGKRPHRSIVIDRGQEKARQ